MKALSEAGVPIPELLSLCEDSRYWNQSVLVLFIIINSISSCQYYWNTILFDEICTRSCTERSFVTLVGPVQ